MMQGIKHIIFDLGNVILNISYEETADAFSKLGFANFQQVFSKASQNKMADDIETGHVDEMVFLNYLQAQCAEGTSLAQVENAWNAIIINFPIRRLQILQQLQLHFNLYLLSNTNCIHERCYNQLLMQQHGIPTLGVFFDKVYLSHHIGLRKPDPKAWELILNNHQLLPHETLFIDDSIQHIEAAKLLGIQTIHITDEMSIEKDVFKQV
jgi:glucose-1-phosphatase